MIRRILLVILLLILLLIAYVIITLPETTERFLQMQMAEHGMADAQVKVESINLHEIRFRNISFSKPVPVTIQNAAIDYNGNWQIAHIGLQHLPVEIPPLKGKGTLELGDALRVNAAFISEDGKYHTSIAYMNPGMLSVTEAVLPWGGGIISVMPFDTPFPPSASFSVPLRLQKVPLDALLALMLSGKATATGTVSGTLPVIILPKGGFMLGQGVLSADGAGTVVVSPEAIPANNDQLALLKSLLADFHYRQLSLTTSGKDDKLSILLSLSGNNPAVYNGREIKLNVNLSGDVLQTLKQSVLPMADPKEFLEENK